MLFNSPQVMLSRYGVVLPKHAIIASQFLVRSTKKYELVREFDVTGISYNESEDVNVMLRVFVDNSPETHAILNFAGINIQSIDMQVAPVVEGEEEGEDESQGKLFYFEYPVSSSPLDSKKLPIQMHPRFIRLSAKESSAESLDKQLKQFMTAVSHMGATLDFQPQQDDDLEDEDNLGAPRGLTNDAKRAQVEAYRAQENDYRDRAEKKLEWFERNIIKTGIEHTDIPFSEAVDIYKDFQIDDKEMLSADRLLLDLNAELVTIDN